MVDTVTIIIVQVLLMVDLVDLVTMSVTEVNAGGSDNDTSITRGYRAAVEAAVVPVKMDNQLLVETDFNSLILQDL